MDAQLERKIIIGIITSTEYLQGLRKVWDIRAFESTTARRLASWVWDYFEKYNKAPGKEIATIFYQKLKENNLPKDIAEEIEQDILPDLSEEYTQEQDFNIDYLLDVTLRYFRERKLILHAESIQTCLTKGEVDEAEQLASTYKPVVASSETDLDLSSQEVLTRIDKAFDTTNQNLIYFPKQLGEFWNDQLVRGGFVALMASEKRGKTFMLLEFAMRACKQGRKVAFFQAGDMTEGQLLKRICIYLTRTPDRKYEGEIWEPVRDCVYNQTNDCDKEERECRFGVFEGENIKTLREEIELKDLIKAYKDNTGYKPCYNCKEYEKNCWGTVWIQPVQMNKVLTKSEAKNAVDAFFIKNKRNFRLSTHANGTLSVKQIEAILAVWEKQDGFVPDIIIIDYADLLEDTTKEFRHKQNEIWKGLRKLSQEHGQPLVITATQADARSYEQDRLRLSNFSEDKRKYAHCTAMYGLNQDVKGREKKIGMMRINQIVVREGEFSTDREVTILQDLRRGRPFIGSFW